MFRWYTSARISPASGVSMVQLISRSIFGCLVATLFAPLCDAQTNVGRISGSVQDASGASVPGCAVTVSKPATSFRQTAQTDSSGSFVFPSLPAGTYNVRVEHQGFK